jgi:hypothetical protein
MNVDLLSLSLCQFYLEQHVRGIGGGGGVADVHLASCMSFKLKAVMCLAFSTALSNSNVMHYGLSMLNWCREISRY